ncbi:MAG: TetR/AcrR family transcriptional regulator [Kiloniellales bacterium]
MPWQKSFDVEQAVDQAMEVFWAKGYEATSMADLLEATGINKGSLYNAFGSKKKLFVRALLKYDREQRQAALGELADLEDPLTAIELLFESMVAKSLSDKDCKGCMLVNTALDLPNHDGDVARIVRAGMKDLDVFFRQQIALGQSQGSIPPDRDPASTAQALLALLVGLRVLARGASDEAGLRAIKQQALALLS